MPKKVILPLVIILAAGAVLFLYYRGTGKGTPALQVTGIIDGTEVNLAPKVSGRISWICCSEGDLVKEGQPVITLESDDITASVEQAKAGVEVAKSVINSGEAAIANARANILSADADTKSAVADVEKARVQMEESDREAERAKELLKNEFISRESYDQTVTAYHVNAAAYNSSREKLNSTRARKDAAVTQLNSSVSQLNSAKAQLKEAEANLAFYRSKLDDMTIKTTVSGTVIFKAFEKGETVSPGVTIMTVVDLNGLYARTDVDETKIARVVLNGPASVTVEGLPGRVFSGRITEIGRYAEFATQRDVIRGREDIKTFRVKVRVDDSAGMLKPGMTVNVELPGKP